MTMESAEEAQAVVDKFDSHVSCFWHLFHLYILPGVILCR